MNQTHFFHTKLFQHLNILSDVLLRILDQSDFDFSQRNGASKNSVLRHEFQITTRLNRDMVVEVINSLNDLEWIRSYQLNEAVEHLNTRYARLLDEWDVQHGYDDTYNNPEEIPTAPDTNDNNGEIMPVIIIPPEELSLYLDLDTKFLADILADAGFRVEVYGDGRLEFTTTHNKSFILGALKVVGQACTDWFMNSHGVGLPAVAVPRLKAYQQDYLDQILKADQEDSAQALPNVEERVKDLEADNLDRAKTIRDAVLEAPDWFCGDNWNQGVRKQSDSFWCCVFPGHIHFGDGKTKHTIQIKTSPKDMAEARRKVKLKILQEREAKLEAEKLVLQGMFEKFVF